MKLTKSQLKNIILQELRIALIQSSGGCLGEENGVDYDLDMPDDEEEEGSHTLGPVPDALTQNRSGMGSISEEEDDVGPYDAPPLRAPPARPPRQEIDQVIDDIVGDLEQDTFGEMPKSEVIELLLHISNIYLGG
jgi:hypothetical protein